MKSDLCDIDVWIVAETSIAVKVQLAERIGRPTAEAKDGVWLPKSQVEIERKEGAPAILTLPEWRAVERGLV